MESRSLDSWLPRPLPDFVELPGVDIGPQLLVGVQVVVLVFVTAGRGAEVRYLLAGAALLSMFPVFAVFAIA